LRVGGGIDFERNTVAGCDAKGGRKRVPGDLGNDAMSAVGERVNSSELIFGPAEGHKFNAIFGLCDRHAHRNAL
jgi:hypothetical protein